MAQINGTLVLLQDDGTAFGFVTDSTLNVNMDLPDSSTKDSSGWAEHITGQRSWDVSVDGFASFGTTDNTATFFDYIADRTDVDIEFQPDTASADVTGAVNAFTGTASMGSVSFGAPNEDTATISGTFTGNGTLTRTAIS